MRSVRHQLEIINPDSRYIPVEQFFKAESPLQDRIQASLSQLDTGISSLKGISVPWANFPASEAEKDELMKTVQEETVFRTRLKNEIYVISRIDGELKAEKMVAMHLGADGKETPFNMSWESDGTLRVIDLLPAFFTVGVQSSQKVYLIDELDRSLHPSLTRHLVETYLPDIYGRWYQQKHRVSTDGVCHKDGGTRARIEVDLVTVSAFRQLPKARQRHDERALSLRR